MIQLPHFEPKKNQEKSCKTSSFSQDWKSLDLPPPEPSSSHPLVDDTTNLQVSQGGFQASFGSRSGEMTLLQNLGPLAKNRSCWVGLSGWVVADGFMGFLGSYVMMMVFQ